MDNEEDSEHLEDPDFLGDSASKFTPRDVRSLKVEIRSADNANGVLPIIPNNQVIIPQEYVLPGVNRALLLQTAEQDMNIVQLSQNNRVRSFINTLHQVVKNSGLDIGTSESLTDTLVAHMLYHTFDFDSWPLGINLRPRLKFNVGGVSISAIPEFVIKSNNYVLLIVEDKHLRNRSIGPTNNYGEPQIVGEMIACGNENVLRARVSYDVTVFVARVISTYVTFYRATIRKEYWDELADGCPRNQSFTVTRWPPNSDPVNGFDLAEPNGRQSVLEALCKIHFTISRYQPE